MTPKEIMDKLLVGELRQQENLITLLGAVKGSKASGTASSMPSLVRGMCTINQKLVNLTRQSLAQAQSAAAETEVFKLFVNEFVLWFESNFVVFEKLQHCISEHHLQGAVYNAPVLHCATYTDMAVSVSYVLRNPFILEKLAEVRARCAQLTETNYRIVKKSSLNDISFDHVQTFGGKNVSCFFTPDQIVKRTEDACLFMGRQKVEMLLLNLGQRQQPEFDSLAILTAPPAAQKRSVLYPPFRVNELLMTLSYNCINFTSFAMHSNLARPNCFAITGTEKLVRQWYNDLSTIFPTEDRLLQSNSVQLCGLGIETMLDSSDANSFHSQPHETLPATSEEPLVGTQRYSHKGEVQTDAFPGSLHESLPEAQYESRESLDSSQLAEIMRKTFSDTGIEPDNKTRHLTVMDPPAAHRSVSAEYAYPEEVEAYVLPNSDSIKCFDMVNAREENAAQMANLALHKEAAASMPDLSARQHPKPVYINSAGSAIDVSNFGKTHNPSFGGVALGEGKRVVKKKSFLDLFRKKKKDTGEIPREAENRSKEEENRSKEETKSKQEEKEASQSGLSVHAGTPDLSYPEQTTQEEFSKPQKTPAKKHPELHIDIPKIGAMDVSSSQPGSALSTANRTLPLPFALPSSTSTYFFRPYMNTGSTSEVNESSSSLAVAKDEKTYVIPQEFKDVVNSEETVDFYISPTSANSLKVSKWKNRCGRWELLTANDNVFLKIVANYDLFKAWLLVFKEEYDETYDEVVDKPLMVLDLNDTTNTRQSTALDVEIQGVDAFSKKKQHVMVRCYESLLVQAICSNLNNILEVMGSKKLLRGSSSYESSATLSSSLLSKPSASSTLTSIFTQADQKHTPTSSNQKTFATDDDMIYDHGHKILLDRMTIKLHRQMESYQHIHQVSSWKPLAMYSLSILHSTDSHQKGFYHFDLTNNESARNQAPEECLWLFPDTQIERHIERIGKAAMLVKVSSDDIYMLECRGRKELKRLVSLF